VINRSENKVPPSMVNDVLSALESEDWKAFAHLCTPELTIATFVRMYRDPSRHELDALLFDFKDGGDVSQSIVRMVEVDTKTPLSKSHRTLFLRFCRFAKKSLAFPNRAWISSGGDLETPEIPMRRGPAIDGKIASNAYWRIEMEQHASRWLIVRMILGVR
jgi:hypothetical protein